MMLPKLTLAIQLVIDNQGKKSVSLAFAQQ